MYLVKDIELVGKYLTFHAQKNKRLTNKVEKKY